ncbi:MAG: thermonuclease family protein [Brevinematales bacterium]|nr:thermonuclease family protein [Brevinematales bacterium]
MSRTAFYSILFALLCLSRLEAYEVRVLYVIDGDTFTGVTNTGFYEKKDIIVFRLYGIDAPEKKQNYGLSSKTALFNLISGKQVEIIKDYGKDKYDRNIVLLTYSGTNICEEMIRMGSAWVYDYYCKDSFYKDWLILQEKAKKTGLGLWEDPNAVPPWVYRDK